VYSIHLILWVHSNMQHGSKSGSVYWTYSSSSH